MVNDLETQPATKGDLAQVKEELSTHIDELASNVAALGGQVDTLDEKVETLQQTMKDGFEHIEHLLSRPPEGLIPRVKKVEEAKGVEEGA